MSDYTVADVQYDDNGDVSNFLLLSDSGEPEPKKGTPENLLLYDPDDTLPFDGGMHGFLSGESALRISSDPEIYIAQNGSEYSYIISIHNNPVETTPEQAETVLSAIYDALSENDTTELERVYDRIISKQVRRKLVGVLKRVFDEPKRISVTDSGWLVDDYYLVDWNARLYSKNDDPDEPDYERSGSTVKKDTSHEFIRMSVETRDVLDGETVTIDGNEYRLTEREMMFLGKVAWLLNRHHYHPDDPYWLYCDSWADMEKEEPDLDTFSF